MRVRWLVSLQCGLNFASQSLGNVLPFSLPRLADRQWKLLDPRQRCFSFCKFLAHIEKSLVRRNHSTDFEFELWKSAQRRQ